MKILVTLMFLSFFISFSAQADVCAGAELDKNFKVDDKDFGDLTIIKDACAYPEHYNHQNPPANITILCRMDSFGWRMGKPGTMSFPGLKTMVSQVTTNKMGVGVPQVSFRFPQTRASFPCPNFVNTHSCAEMSFSLSCDDIASMDNSIDYCNAQMMALVEADESLMVTVPTGKTSTGCGMGGGHGQN